MERNAAHANEQEGNSEAPVSGAYFDDNDSLGTQNKPVSSNAGNSASKKTVKKT